MNRGSCVSRLCSIVLCLGIPAWADPLPMTFDDDALIVSSLEPGAEVVSLTMQCYVRRYAPLNKRRDEVWRDDDGDGVVRIPLTVVGTPETLPPKTVVIVVELATGRFGVATPAGSPGREVALPSEALTAGLDGQLERLLYRGSYLELFLVRPGLGAWGLTTGDGTAADESPPSDGLTETRPRSLSPIGESGAVLESYLPGDLLFGISPINMEYFAVRIAP